MELIETNQFVIRNTFFTEKPHTLKIKQNVYMGL